jgi:hypothetical protein
MALLALAAGQTIWFAASQRTSSDGSPPMPPAWQAEIAKLPAGQRVLINNGMIAETGPANGFLNVCGSNPLVLNRTARFLAAAQGLDWTGGGAGGFSLNNIGINYPVQFASPAYKILRCGAVMPGMPEAPAVALPGALPRLLLLNECRTVAGADAALAAMSSADFDANKTVMLESRPRPLPTPDSAGGSARIVSETTDALEIEADLPASRILLITDAYSAGWRASPLAGAIQTDYEVLPADYCLRAVPLTAGHHHFRLEYRPGGVIAGAWISIVVLISYMLFAAVAAKKYLSPQMKNQMDTDELKARS